MTDTPKLVGTDTLRQAYPKINQSIDRVNNFKSQIDQMVIEGDSSVEAAQARVKADGTVKTTLKDRLDESDAQLAQTTHKEAHVKSFPRLAPEVSDHFRIQRTIDSIDKGNVILSENYEMLNQIVVPDGINLICVTGTMVRKFNKDVSGAVIRLQGNNIVEGLRYDGGSKEITVSGQDFIFYSDINADNSNGNIIVTNCVMENTCGSYVLANAKNVTVVNNIFGEFLDHMVYVGGRTWGANVTETILISGNTLNSYTSTRDAFKIRNGAKIVNFTNNVGFVLNGRLFDVNIGDDQQPSRLVESVSISDNNIFASSFGRLTTKDSTPIKQVNISDNIGSFTHWILALGEYTASPTVQNGLSVESIVVSGNNLKTTQAYALIINGQVDNAINHLKLSDNIWEWNGSTFADIIGNVQQLSFNNDTFINKVSAFSYNNNLLRKPTDHNNRFKHPSNKLGAITIENCKFYGHIWSIFTEDTTSKTSETVLATYNWRLDGNIYNAPEMFREINISGNNALGVCSIGDNVYRVGSYQSPVFPTTRLKHRLMQPQPSSTATDVDGLKADFNQLLARLRQSGFLRD